MKRDEGRLYIQKRNKFQIRILLGINVLIWGTVLFFWISKGEPFPNRQENFAMATEINRPIVHEIPSFRFNAAMALTDTNLLLYSNNALLLNLSTGEILFDFRGNERIYPASVTKIMTVLVGLEHAINDEVKIRYDADAIYLAEASVVGFVNGEIRTLSEVLHGSFLSSGADATSSLAYHVAGSYEGFVTLMNQTAAKIGMHDTSFMNASGLHHYNHFTTAYDIALLLDYAITVPYFMEIFTTRAYNFINYSGNTQVMHSFMFNHMPDATFNGGTVLGGMTGFTTPAGFCLASIATDGLHDYALITFGADFSPQHIWDAFTIYEYFLSN